jgi:predicted RNase H-like HicB family nuclease
MTMIRYVYWKNKGMWLGYLEEFPDYMTQGRTVTELKENLKDIYDELTSGRIPGVRRVAKLKIA